MEKQLNMFRNEIKYYIHKRQAAELRMYLKNNTKIDLNGDDTGTYWIRSLYFDTINNRDYNEKIVGHNIRKKIRLRIYDLSTSSVKLEIKNKHNNLTLKETATISTRDAQELIEGSCHSLLKYKMSTTNKVFALMHQNLYHPTVIIDYEREAYLYDFQNIRITIDKDLRTTFSSDGFFDNKVNMIPILNNDIYVLEIKYDHMIPMFLQKVLWTFPLQRSQVSKYCLGRNILGK